MKKYCRPGFQRGEIVTVVQGLFDGLAPAQAMARKKLVESEIMDWAEATAFVKKVGPEISAMILELSTDDLQIVVIEQQFVAAQLALQSRYLT